MFPPTQMRFSKDGRWLLVNGNGVASAFDLSNPGLNSSAGDLRNFDKNYGLETFPRTWFDNKRRFLFAPSPGRVVALSMAIRNEADLMEFEEGHVRTAWSKQKNEVYGELSGEIWVWDWTSGKLKRRMLYSKSRHDNAVFSPDGKWLLVAEQVETNCWELRRYHVSNGQLADKGQLTNGTSLILVMSNSMTLFRFGFSPDGRYIWFNQPSGEMPDSFNWVPNTETQLEQSAIKGSNCSGPSKWVPDGRIGIAKSNSFEWHDAAGQLLGRLPGPFQARIFGRNASRLEDWVLSPDGNWIYSAERGGAIRRWRAR